MKKFYIKHFPIPGINIPIKSFKEYVIAYN